MKKLLFNLIDFFGKRINAPPIYKNLKIFLLSHEKVYSGEIMFILFQENQLKKLCIMKKTFVILVFLTLNSFLFAQTMQINGHSTNPDPYVANICQNGTMLLNITTSINVSDIDSVRVFEYISTDTCQNYSTPIKLGVGSNLSWSIPMSGLAVQGYCYKYLIQIYYGGSGARISGLCRINVVDLPTAMLSASSSTICAGEEVTFLASGGAIYEFKVNGVREQIGETNLFSSSLLNNNDTVVVVVSENGCSTTEPISMTVHEIPDLGSVTLSPTCYGDDMEFTYSGLTGSGFWTLSFWNTEHNVQYGDDYSVTSSGGLLTVPIEYGTNEVHLKIIDTATGCSNF